MNDNDLLRYSRQIMLPQFDVRGQQQIMAAHFLVIGAGGLGSPAAMYLAAAGAGQLTIADGDVVELSNLQRQLLHHDRDIGIPKVDSARTSLLDINPQLQVRTLHCRLEAEQLAAQVAACDVVLDCSDNFTTRFAINAACFAARKPLVSAAAVRFEGQLSAFDARDADSPCYACLYREGESADETCAANGVLAPVVGAIGTLQALEAIKLLLQLGETLVGRLVVFDGLAHEWRTLKLARDPGCPVCGNRQAIP
jgi:molybdopterin/thiamine biosynthesis adenylyltransferase